MRARFLAVAALVVIAGSRLAAHPAPFSYLDVVFRDGSIEGTLVVHVIDVAHELGLQPADLMHPEVVRQNAAKIGDVLRPRILLRSSRQIGRAHV